MLWDLRNGYGDVEFSSAVHVLSIVEAADVQ